MKPTKRGWDKNCGIYHCSDGTHLSFWLAIVRTQEWEAWEKEVSKRMHLKDCDEGVWDVDECRECGWMSEEHAKDFLKFIRTQYKPKKKTK